MSDSRGYSLKKIAKYPFVYARNTKVGIFLMCIAIATALTYFLGGDHFVRTQYIVLFLLFFSILLWFTEAIPPFAVGIFIVGYLIFFMGREGTMDVKHYVQTWSDGVIWLFLGGFFLAEAMRKTRLDIKLLIITAPRFGDKAKYIILGLMIVTAILSMVMSNTATTAMMLATVTPLFSKIDNKALQKAFLLGIPSAAAIGGMGTIIGSAPNAIAVGALEAIGIKISFLQWMSVGVPVALLLTFMTWKLLLNKYKLGELKLSIDFIKDLERKKDQRKEEKLQKRIVLIVLMLTIFLWLTSQWSGIPVAAVSGIPIVALTMMGIIDADDVRKLPWDTLMLVAGGLALGIAIQEQELALYFVSKISVFDMNVYLLLVLFSLLTVALSNFMSNTAATTILVPVAISLISIYGDVNPVIFTMVIGLSASCALLLPVSTPPNAIVYSTGLVEQSEFRLGGLFIGLAGPVVIILWTLLLTFIFS
ncbi:SLC13 family permease [uncultured Planktosalinus sp.]|uniref:SLC13 family permease n=1 Tax=uncultured Planktosalinus sp. TaxID=1810935 RepID=UPI0030D842F4